MTTRILLRIGIGVLALGAAAAAQGKKEQPTLGAVAKATQEEKAKAGAEDTTADNKSAAKADVAAKAAADEHNAKATAGKKYTNEHLDGRPRPSSPSANRTALKGAAMVSSENASQDEAYWRSRAEPLRQRLQYNTDRLNSAKAQLERARTEGGLYVAPSTNGRTPPVQAERQRLASRVQDLEAEVRRDQQAITELEEDARRAGALPGWLR